MEREVEREAKEAPAKLKASFSQLAQPKAKERPKPTSLKANKGKEAKGMEEVDAEEEEEKKKNKGKGKGKARPGEGRHRAGSIMGFFKKARAKWVGKHGCRPARRSRQPLRRQSAGCKWLFTECGDAFIWRCEM